MALRDEHDFLSENERQFLANGSCHKCALTAASYARSACSSSAARAKRRCSWAVVGFLHFAVELSTMTSPSFDAATSAGCGFASSVAAAELARLVACSVC
ncbi:hypothetical protein PF005_g25049 [Phytophthora fragariae]|uniref:Uncharacterized protein n=1 Tax=Phytophthora fragariae TaxID=53985 RepID=A0A6A3I116_9STRA|nr:hypothetical protein PF003_g40147 [Phytophthora fragariae]KAE8923947.1 hypothetical protein PF009_g25813 [Phytophthora fragariae]KAE8976526.1 hypothetical protein PF011_g24012 [Phytophthora fragariae]KAE9075324.1 hypothetical protein PF007_g25056 [Phytophthora fragariae]KAE9075404.1 hypothetical protein PF010_g24314 [Phytophthora fragariae]